MAKNATDRAIVAGVNNYPGLSNLDGPVNDAQAFRDWLVADDGGGLDPANVEIILSPDPFPQGAAPSDARPTSEQIADAFRRLQALGKKLGLNQTIGRRLYIFLAGHGFAPNPGQSQAKPALLTANADEDNLRHVPGYDYAEWFRNRAWFEEVVLVMDCCREGKPTVPIEFTWPARNNPGGPAERFFYGFAAKKGSVAREKPIAEDQGKVHGIFSWALLEGLRGGARDGTRITGRSLAGFLKSFVPKLVAAGEVTGIHDDATPDVDYSDFDDALVFFEAASTTPAVNWPVSIALTPASQGKALEITNGTFNPDGTLKILHEAQPTGDRWKLEVLDKGFYLVRAKDGTAQAFFQVPGNGGDDAHL